MTRREWVEWLVWLSGSAAAGAAPPDAKAEAAGPAKAIAPPPVPPALRWFHTVADDFVVDIWHNGVLLPDSCREVTAETYGATAEKITRDVQPGDWLAFHVVNNRFRWGGAKYFGFVGFAAAGDPALVSDVESGRWSACEAPGQVAEFLAKPKSPADQPVAGIAAPWDGGAAQMNAYAGGLWTGTPVWGAAARSVWLKVRVPG